MHCCVSKVVGSDYRADFDTLAVEEAAAHQECH